ncbi:MAG: protein kinase [Myxococcales bacterium]|nr:protein kinase [Myxococcales bacterium]
MAPLPEQFGPYEILRRLGVGGMAETFVAVRRGPGAFEQHVCLKRVLPAFEGDADFVRLFLEEATMAASLRHSNIVGVIDFGDVEGTHYMALELVEGVDLRNLLGTAPGRRLTEDMALHVALELTQALRYAHAHERDGQERGIVHRDVSPSNVLVSHVGEVKLADFGIAKAMQRGAATASGAVKGKVPYMSPEQARAEPIDGRTDLFALGVLLFEVLAGERPFDGKSDVETLQRIVAGQRPSIVDLAATLSPGFADIIERLLASDRNDRFQGAGPLFESLAALPTPPAMVRVALGDLARSVRPMPVESGSQRTSPEVDRTALATPRTIPEGRSSSDAETRTSGPGPAEETPTAIVGVTVPSRSDRPRGGVARRRSSLIALGAVLTVVAASLGSAWIGPSGEDGTPRQAPSSQAAPLEETQALAEGLPEGGPPTVPGQAPTTEQAPATRETAASGDGGVPAEEAPAQSRKGTVVIHVEPWGNVWIDGDFMGRAPVRAVLSPGVHVIAAGRDGPTVRRRRRIRPGVNRRLLLTLPLP